MYYCLKAKFNLLYIFVSVNEPFVRSAIWLKKLTELLESGYVSCKYHRSNFTIFNFSSEPTVFGYLLSLRNIILRFIALEGFAVAIWLSYFCLLGFLPFLFLLSSLVPGMTQELLVLFFNCGGSYNFPSSTSNISPC